MPHPADFQLVGGTLVGRIELADARFFPSLFYRGCTVKPLGWTTEAIQPLLLVHAMPEDIDTAKYFVKPPAAGELWQAMRADGWDWDARDGGAKYVHVDELEKIEGSPPDSAH